MGSSDIEKLSDTTHFPDWAMQMEALLEEKELWDVVTGDEPVPTTGPTSKAMKNYVRKQKSARAKIILHLHKSQLPHARFDTPKEIWDNLKRVHQARGYGTVLAMRRKFFSMGKLEDQSMQAWIASVRDIAYRLEAADFKINDVDLILALTQGLPEEYTSLIVSLDATPVDQLSVDSVINRLLNEEQRQTSNQDHATTIAMVARAKSHKPVWSNSRKSNSKAGSVAGGSRSPHSIRCYNCGGRGHMARDCPSPKQEGDKANFVHNEDSDTNSVVSC